MVRTKADNSARKAVAAKAPRKALAPTRGAAVMSPSSGGKRDKYSGGNPVNPQPTPEWQKSISKFFTITSPSSSGKENEDPEDGPCSSKDVERTEEEAGGSSSSQEQKPEQMEAEEQGEEQVEEESEEEEEGKPAPSKSFKRNKCISDSEDDDE